MAATSNLDLSDPKVIAGLRIFDAPRSLVFSAFTDPRHLSQWWGPNGFTTTTHSFDFRPGGVWHFVMHGPDGRDYQNRITFGEIVPNERLTWIHGGGEDEEHLKFHQTLTFDDVGGKTRLTWRGEFATAEERARVIRDHGAAEGLVQTMSRLADYVSQLKA